jgi:hypothetical protein
MNFIIDFFEGCAYYFLCSYILVAFSSGHAMDSMQIRELLHDDSDSYSEFSQDSDIDVFDHVDLDAEICGPGLHESCSNSDNGEESANVGGGGGVYSGGYDDEDGDSEDWVLG